MIYSEEGIFEGEGGLVLRWQTWAPEEPRARILLVHGLGEHSGRYGVVAGALAGRGFAVFTYDMRGHGRSAGPRGHADSFDVLARDLGHAAREARIRLPGKLPEALVAHSLGGLVALRYLQSFAEVQPDVAVISAPWLKTKRHIAGWLVSLAGFLDRVWPSAPLSRSVDPSQLTRDPVMIEAYLADRHVHGRLSPRLYFEVLRAQEKVRANTTGFPFPTLFLIPGGDPIVDSAATEAFARGLEGDVEVLELPGLRHEPFNEVERDDVLADVGDWLSRRLPRTGFGEAGSSSPEPSNRTSK